MNEDQPEEHQQEDSCKEAQFLKGKFNELVAGVTSVMPLADDLKSKNMIHEETYSKIRAEETNREKMRTLMTAVCNKGVEVIKAFYDALSIHEPYLFKELGGVTRKRKLSDTKSERQAKKIKPNTENKQQFEPNYNNDTMMAPPQPATQYNVTTNIHIEEKKMCSLNQEQSPAPKKVKKLPAPKKERKPIAPKKEKKLPAPKKEKKPFAPKKEKNPLVPKKEKKPLAPKTEKPPAPKKEKKHIAPKTEKPPVPKKQKKPPAPKKPKKPPAPKKQKKPPAPKKPKKPPAPKKQKKPPAPRKPKKPPATKKQKKRPAPKK